MRPFLFTLVFVFVLALTPLASAGNPHYVGNPTVTRTGDVLTVSGKVAGLGNEEQIHVEVTADAQCVNRGGNEPSADNKDEVSVAGDFPVQNGKALFSLDLDGAAQIDPDCAPPMRIVYSNVVVSTDTDGDGVGDLVFTVAGTF